MAAIRNLGFVWGIFGPPTKWYLVVFITVHNLVVINEVILIIGKFQYLMLLLPIIFCFIKIQNGLPFWCQLFVLENTHTHTHTHNCFTALWILSGTTRVSRYQKKHSPTHTHRGHQSSLSAFSIYYDPWHPPYQIHVL